MSTIVANDIFLFFAIFSLGGLAGFFCERVGIVNLGVEGQMAFGAGIFAIFGSIVGTYDDGTNTEQLRELFLIGFVIVIIASLLLSALFGYLTIKLKANHVIVGTAINLLVVGVLSFITQPLGVSIDSSFRKLNTKVFLGTWEMGDSGIFFSNVLMTIIAVVIIIVSAIAIYKTKFGLRFVAIGDNPNAVDAQGVNVNYYKWLGVIISGVLSSLAGAIFAYSLAGDFNGGVNGMGFLSIAVMIAGIWRVEFITVVSIVFGILISYADNAAIDGIHPDLAKMIPYAGTLGILFLFSWRSHAPEASGQHFDKSAR